MDTEKLIFYIFIISLIILIAACSSIFLKKLKFPYTIGLVIVGLFLAMLLQYKPALKAEINIVVFHGIIYYILLPVLIFDAAVNLNSRLLARNIIPVLLLAAPGLVVSLLIVGAIVYFSTPLLLGPALLFGALISATDPVAVIALFKEIGAPKRLTMLVDGESIFNDATAIVAFNVIFGIVVSGAGFGLTTILGAILEFVWVFAGGALCGIIIGFGAVYIMSLTKKDPIVIVLLTTILAFLSFIIADHFLKVSGVMSTLGAGVTVNWYSSTRLKEEAKEYIIKFWEYATFAANSFIFISLGLVEWSLFHEISDSKSLLYYIGWCVFAIIIGRAVIVYGFAPLIKLLPKQRKINIFYQTIIFWGGLRGAVPLALAFGLSSEIQGSQLILQFTLGVVLFTLIVQGISTKYLIKLFRLDRYSVFECVLSLQAALQAIIRARDFLKKIRKNKYVEEGAIKELIQKYENEGDSIINKLMSYQESPHFNSDVLKKLFWFEAIAIERNTYKKLLNNGLISAPVYRSLDINIDYEIEHIKDSELPEIRVSIILYIHRLWEFISNAIGKLFPSSSLVNSVRFWSIKSEYELLLALRIACNRISESLDSMPLIYQNQKEIVSECKEFFLNRVDLAVKERERLSKYMSMLKMQKKYLERSAINEEFETIESLFETGYIPASVAKNLENSISTKLS